MKVRSLNQSEKKQMLKRLKRIIEELINAYVIVEGKKDVASLASVGIRAHTIRDIDNANGNVIVLTDMDREGNRLAKAIEEKLLPNPNVKSVDIKTREVLCGMLNINTFEAFGERLKKVENELMEVV